MPANAHVLILYGPYESCGVVEHRTARLQGMQMVLLQDGHYPEIKSFDDRNVVEVWVNGELVYKCDIRDLDYGGDGQLDPLCAEVLTAVRNAF